METKYPHLIVAYGSNLDAEDWKAYCERNDADRSCLQFEDVQGHCQDKPSCPEKSWQLSLRLCPIKFHSAI